MKRVFFALLLWGMNAFAAGGWSSGGGELLRDSHNPWFLNNTTDVRYCIRIDEKNFGTTRSEVSTQVLKALQYWKTEFSVALLPNLKAFGPIKIASQNFKEVDCAERPEISLQFGELSATQYKYLENPSLYAAVTVRTDYDVKRLMGRGFIYFSPSRGPLRYASQNMIADAWAVDDGNLLYLTLLHEFGHVFGLPHIGSIGDLMSESFVGSLLLKQKSRMATQVPRADGFFSPSSKTPRICNAVTLNSVKRVFGNSGADRCVRFEFDHEAQNQLFGKTTVQVFTYESVQSQNKHLVGKVELKLATFVPATLNLIWITSAQTVFSKQDIELLTPTQILGVSLFAIQKQGTFLLPDGKTRHGLILRFEQGKSLLSVNGIVDSQLIPLID